MPILSADWACGFEPTMGLAMTFLSEERAFGDVFELRKGFW